MGSPFSAHDTSIGKSPFTIVQTAETASPQFAGSSLIENGAICGATENDIFQNVSNLLTDSSNSNTCVPASGTREKLHVKMPIRKCYSLENDLLINVSLLLHAPIFLMLYLCDFVAHVSHINDKK